MDQVRLPLFYFVFVFCLKLNCNWYFVLGAGAAAAGLLAITPGSSHMVRQVFGQVSYENVFLYRIISNIIVVPS